MKPMFTKPANQATGQQRLMHPPLRATEEDATYYSRTVEGLQNELSELRSANFDIKQENRHLESVYQDALTDLMHTKSEVERYQYKVKGYDSMTHLTSEQVQNYPRIYRKKVTELLS